ncbi:MAG: acetate/propionate family kinase [Actinomycetota bacterium]
MNDLDILAVNCGSSSLKFELVCATRDADPPKVRRLAEGIVDRIGKAGRLRFSIDDGSGLDEPATIADHGEGIERVLDWVPSPTGGGRAVHAVGHRVVHGGDRFSGPVLIDDAVEAAIDEASRLAPLHNPPALAAIRAARRRLPGVPMSASFDTAFHATLPEHAYRYALPPDLADPHRIRRYGFHGLAHRWMTERYAAIAGRPLETVRLITLQLGNGSSAAAIAGGRSVDTSMGMTPLEGLVMGTRSGDLDPAIPGFLAREEQVGIREVERWLNHRSGLLGLSGRSNDVRELLEAEAAGDEAAARALDVYCYRVRKYIGAYLAVVGGAEAVIFGGGIGENQPAIRERICDGMEWCGLVLDRARNREVHATEAKISAQEARLAAYVVPVDEMAVIAQDVLACLPPA